MPPGHLAPPRIARLVLRALSPGRGSEFPYVIFYEYEDEIVTVYSVFHTAQDPMKWKHKLP
jgi:hypothetical protein